MSFRRNHAQTEPPTSTGKPALRLVFWVLVITLYVLGAFSLAARTWLFPNRVGLPAPVATAATVSPAPTEPEATEAIATSSPFPTLTPRSTLYPTLTPSP
ncbi:MAG: hypothetical protein GXX94_01840 [Chloroflexi bacterium]|nr:hypothetical protein [Chloroflexota bacterium]